MGKIENTAKPLMAIVMLYTLSFDSFGQHIDPALAAFVQSLVAEHPRIRAAEASYRAGTANAAAASQPLYNPELEGEWEDSSERTTTLGISQVIDWSDKRSAHRDIGKAAQQIISSELRATRWAVTIELLQALADFQSGTEKSALSVQRARLMRNFADLSQRRFSAGDITQVERALASIAALEAEMKTASAAAMLFDARQAILSFRPPTASTWPSLPSSFPSIAKKPDLSLLHKLPEVNAARLQVEKAKANVALRQKERRPDPTIGVMGGKDGYDGLVTVSLSIPLPVRNRFKHEVSAATADLVQAQELADNALLQSKARWVSRHIRYQMSLEAWQAWEKTGQESLDQQTNELSKLWEAGEISTTDYLVQLRQTLDVQDSALDLKRMLWDAWFEWLLASGQIENWLKGATG